MKLVKNTKQSKKTKLQIKSYYKLEV